MNIEYNNSVVQWNDGGKNIEYHVNGIEFASQQNDLIRIEIYDEGIFSYCFVDKEGKFILSYSEDKEILILSTLDGTPKNILISGLKEAAIDNNGRIFVLAGDDSESAIYEYAKNGEVIKRISPPPGYVLYRFDQVSNELQVVCQGDEDKKDQFGRNDWRFTYDFVNNQWKQISLAY